jgi:hypothetical protein
MPKDELHLDRLKERFGNESYFETADLYDFYNSIDSSLENSVIKWRINFIIKDGTILQIGEGRFRFGSANEFEPLLNQTIFEINDLLLLKFPDVKFLIWHSREVTRLVPRLTPPDIYCIEVDPPEVDTVAAFLREEYKHVLTKKVDEALNYDSRVFIVQPLLKRTHYQLVNNVPTIIIEKLIIDLFLDEGLYRLSQEELATMVNDAFTNYRINIDKLLRYASIREKRVEIVALIKKLFNS